MYFNTNSSQNLIVTVTNPPATPRVVFANPTFPNAPFDRTSGLSIRPIQWDVETPRLQVWNVNVQREFWGGTSAHDRLRRARGAAPAAEQRRQHGGAGHRRRWPAVFPGGRTASEHGVDDHRAQELGWRLLVQRTRSPKSAADGRMG